MKRYLSLVLVAVLSVIALAHVGCSNDDAPDARITQPALPDAAPADAKPVDAAAAADAKAIDAAGPDA